jgi:hypothetical protein
MPPGLAFRRADRYEVKGVIDVVTSVQLTDPALRSNPVLTAISARLPRELPPNFEVIIDYKGSRRPPPTSPPAGRINLRELYDWQLQTYAYLRQRQPGALPVVAGVLIYLNEFLPTERDLVRLQREISAGTTDVPVPADVRAALMAWQLRRRAPMKPPRLPFDFRLARALRITPVTDISIRQALRSFDAVVARMEEAQAREMRGTSIQAAWQADASDEQTCAACDHRTYCGEFQRLYGVRRRETRPRLPGVNPVLLTRRRRRRGSALGRGIL